MRVIKAPVSRFKKRVVKRAFRSGSVFLERRKKFGPYCDRYSRKDRGLSRFVVIPLSLGFNLDAFLKNKRNAVVFEIGCGAGNLLADVRQRFKGNIAKTVGLDLHNSVWADAQPFINELRIGNALAVRFPKSDLIVSQWTTGYIRNMNFLLKKIEGALKPGGVALVHFNKKVDFNGPPEIGAIPKNFLLNLAKRNKIGKSGVKVVKADVRVVEAFMKGDVPGAIKDRMPLRDDYFTWQTWKDTLGAMQGDPLVLIQKPEKKP